MRLNELAPRNVLSGISKSVIKLPNPIELEKALEVRQAVWSNIEDVATRSDLEPASAKGLEKLCELNMMANILYLFNCFVLYIDGSL